MLNTQAFVLEEYNAVRHTVGFLDLSGRGKIEAAGSDRISFLHNMISNEVQGLADFTGGYAALLTATGKIIADFFYYRLPESVLIDVDGELHAKLLASLEKFIIMDDVTLKDVSANFAHFSLQGPRSGELVQNIFGGELPAENYHVRQMNWDRGSGWVIRKNELSESGFEILSSSETAAALRASVLERGEELGVREIGEEAWNILRFEAGIPKYGIDMDESHYPMEARLDKAVSLTKGCYPGQEVVARATHLGGVPKLLMGLKIEGTTIPQAGARVLDQEGKEIGIITSALFSPALEQPIAFAYLKRIFAGAGKRYQVEVSPQKFAGAEVVEKFR